MVVRVGILGTGSAAELYPPKDLKVRNYPINNCFSTLNSDLNKDSINANIKIIKLEIDKEITLDV